MRAHIAIGRKLWHKVSMIYQPQKVFNRSNQNFSEVIWKITQNLQEKDLFLYILFQAVGFQMHFKKESPAQVSNLILIAKFFRAIIYITHDNSFLWINLIFRSLKYTYYVPITMFIFGKVAESWVSKAFFKDLTTISKKNFFRREYYRSSFRG